MTQSARALRFKIRTNKWPADWHKFIREWEFSRSNRSTPSFPLWQRAQGKGFAIWLSDPQLQDTKQKIPVWIIQLETLSRLNSDGEQFWHEFERSLLDFFHQYKLDIVDEYDLSE